MSTYLNLEHFIYEYLLLWDICGLSWVPWETDSEVEIWASEVCYRMLLGKLLYKKYRKRIERKEKFNCDIFVQNVPKLS